MNKNTRAFQKAIAQAAKQGKETVTRQVPVKDYHNHPKVALTTQTATVCGKRGTVSESRKRNTRMVIAVNKNEDGSMFSATFHEKINPDFRVLGRHKYIKNYR